MKCFFKFELAIFKRILSSSEVFSNLKIQIKSSITKLKKKILLSGVCGMQVLSRKRRVLRTPPSFFAGQNEVLQVQRALLYSPPAETRLTVYRRPDMLTLQLEE